MKHISEIINGRTWEEYQKEERENQVMGYSGYDEYHEGQN